MINPDTKLSVNAGSGHLDAAMKFVEYFTRAENIQKFADQQSSFNPLQGKDQAPAQEILPLVSCYKSGRTVIGTDALLDLPIWELTTEASQRLLAGEALDTVMDWMDLQVEEDRMP